MPATIVLGTQFGDEGTHLIAGALAREADVMVRFNGCVTAHRAMKLVPSGIIHEGKINVIGPHVLYDLAVGAQEIAFAKKHGANLLLDPATPIVLPIHRVVDGAREIAAGVPIHEIRKSGMKSACTDSLLGRGLTLGDLQSASHVQDALERAGYWNEQFALMSFLGGHNIDLRSLGISFNPFHLLDIVDWCMSFSQSILPLLADTREYVREAIEKDRSVLFEGSDGILRDAYHGTRGSRSMSLSTAAGVSASFGVYEYDQVIGVANAYALDLPRLRHACQVGGITKLVIVNPDVVDPSFVRSRTFSRFSVSAKTLLSAIEHQTGVPVTGVVLGKKEKRILWR